MNQELKNNCELFIENKGVIEKGFKLESAYIYPMCSSIYTSRKMHVDMDKMKECDRILKRKTGILSDYRGNVRMALVSMMAVSERPEEFLSHVMDTYEMLKKGKIFGSEYLIVAAAAICSNVDAGRQEEIVGKSKEIYKLMKENHPILTSDEDSIYAALLAVSGLKIEEVMEGMEKCYQSLKPNFFSGNAVQSLSHILALSKDAPEEKCRKVMDIFNKLKAQGKKYGTGYELSILGGLALLDVEIDAIVSEVVEVDDYLKKQKGFGMLGIGSVQRLLHASLLVMNLHMPETESLQTAALNSVIALIISQQIAMCTVLIAASATAASVSS